MFYAEPLEFGRDLNAARYKDGKRETPNAQVLILHICAQTREACCRRQLKPAFSIICMIITFTVQTIRGAVALSESQRMNMPSHAVVPAAPNLSRSVLILLSIADTAACSQSTTCSGGRQQDSVGVVQGGLHASSSPTPALSGGVGGAVQWARATTWLPCRHQRLPNPIWVSGDQSSLFFFVSKHLQAAWNCSNPPALLLLPTPCSLTPCFCCLSGKGGRFAVDLDVSHLPFSLSCRCPIMAVC